MRLKGLFWILTTLLLTILAVVTYYVFYTSSIRMFFAVEALVLLTIIYLFVFYRRIIKSKTLVPAWERSGKRRRTGWSMCLIR